MGNPRYLAVKLLCKTFSGSSFSNLQLDSGLKNSDLDEREKKFCSVLYYGVIERKITLDHIISSLCSRPVEKLDESVLNILRCGVYQILYMDSIPDSASVNESVMLAKKFRKASASGMVNAVLRNFVRNGRKYSLPDDVTERMSVEYSAPPELVRELVSDHGMSTAEKFLASALQPSKTFVRRNPLKCSEEEFTSELGERVEKVDFLPDCFAVSGGDITSTRAYADGWLHIQGLSSQFCCQVLSPCRNDMVLDMCSAPGGKTFTLAEMMQNSGEIYACDLHEKRLNLVREGAERLGISNIKTFAGDSSEYRKDFPKFDRILCDAVCSGVGMIGSKPEIKYKKISDFSSLPEIQYRILSNALNYLKTGGELVYSTCTIRKAENDGVCDRLLSEHPEIVPAELPEANGYSFGTRATLFPHYSFDSGFFTAKFIKTGGE